VCASTGGLDPSPDCFNLVQSRCASPLSYIRCSPAGTAHFAAGVRAARALQPHAAAAARLPRPAPVAARLTHAGHLLVLPQVVMPQSPGQYAAASWCRRRRG